MGLEDQPLVGGPFADNGLWLREGNTSSSAQEADEVVAIVGSPLEETIRWRDRQGWNIRWLQVTFVWWPRSTPT